MRRKINTARLENSKAPKSVVTPYKRKSIAHPCKSESFSKPHQNEFTAVPHASIAAPHASTAAHQERGSATLMKGSMSVLMHMPTATTNVTALASARAKQFTEFTINQ